jgi:hypothetical protein
MQLASLKNLSQVEAVAKEIDHHSSKTNKTN